jgi:hypothetical protein
VAARTAAAAAAAVVDGPTTLVITGIVAAIDTAIPATMTGGEVAGAGEGTTTEGDGIVAVEGVHATDL